MKIASFVVGCLMIMGISAYGDRTLNGADRVVFRVTQAHRAERLVALEPMQPVEFVAQQFEGEDEDINAVHSTLICSVRAVEVVDSNVAIKIKQVQIKQLVASQLDCGKHNHLMLQGVLFTEGER